MLTSHCPQPSGATWLPHLCRHWPGVVALGLMVALSVVGPAQAQTGAVEGGKPGEAQALAQEWSRLREEVGELEVTDAAQAIQRYREFLLREGERDAEVALQASVVIARLYLYALQDRASGLEVYQWALQRYGGARGAAAVRGELARARTAALGIDPTAPGWAQALEPVQVEAGQEEAKRRALSKSAQAVKVNARTVLTASVVAQLRAGALTPQAAWERGWLNEDDLLLTLSEPAFKVGSSRGYLKDMKPEEYALRQGLVGLLVEHGGERLAASVADPQSLPWMVQESVAHYYRDRRDARAVEWYEAALAHSLEEGPEAGQTPQWFSIRVFYLIEPLAGYYRDVGQIEKAAQTWERVPQMMKQQPLAHPALTSGWWVPDALVEAARSYRAAGDEQKAKELYAQVPQYGDGWLTVLSFYDQALPLIDAGKLDQAKAILSRPITATRSQSEASIAQNAWLASLAYQQGDLEAAMRYGKKVEAAGKPDQNTSVPVKNLYEMGLDIYNRAGGWKTQPIQTDTREVVFQANPSQPEQPLYARFRIKTYGDTSVTATVDNPAFQVRVLPIDNWQHDVWKKQINESEVIIRYKFTTQSEKASLVLTSKLNKNQPTSVSIRSASENFESQT